MTEVQTSLQKYQREFKNLRFKSEAEFEKWLSEKSAFYIGFEDQGQDLMGFWIDQGGEVLQTNLASLGRIFNGHIILLDTLRRGAKVGIMAGNGRDHSEIKYSVKTIRKGK